MIWLVVDEGGFGTGDVGSLDQLPCWEGKQVKDRIEEVEGVVGGGWG